MLKKFEKFESWPLGKVKYRNDDFNTNQNDNEPFQEVWFPILQNFLKEANIMLQREDHMLL